jgi:hypothetical protein
MTTEIRHIDHDPVLAAAARPQPAQILVDMSGRRRRVGRITGLTLGTILLVLLMALADTFLASGVSGPTQPLVAVVAAGETS